MSAVIGINRLTRRSQLGRCSLFEFAGDFGSEGRGKGGGAGRRIRKRPAAMVLMRRVGARLFAVKLGTDIGRRFRPRQWPDAGCGRAGVSRLRGSTDPKLGSRKMNGEAA